MENTLPRNEARPSDIIPTAILHEALSVQGNSKSHAARQSPYDVHNLTVISSTKINQKVKQILQILQSKKDDTQTEISGESNPKDHVVSSSPIPVVSVNAKAPVASKAVTIVEIVKREISSTLDNQKGETKHTDDESGKTINFSKKKYFQYSILHSVEFTLGMLENSKQQRKRKADQKDADEVIDVSESGTSNEDEDESYFEPLESKNKGESTKTTEQPAESLIGTTRSHVKAGERKMPVLTIIISPVRIERLRKDHG